MVVPSLDFPPPRNNTVGTCVDGNLKLPPLPVPVPLLLILTSQTVALCDADSTISPVVVPVVPPVYPVIVPTATFAYPLSPELVDPALLPVAFLAAPPAPTVTVIAAGFPTLDQSVLPNHRAPLPPPPPAAVQ